MIFLWSVEKGQNLASFDPDADQFLFDDGAISAGDISILDGGSQVTLFYGTDFVTLGIALPYVTSGNVTFANGSLLRVGDDTTGITDDSLNNVLAGGAGNDQLRGLAGDDVLNGLGGNDRLNGGADNDAMAGGPGDDSYAVDAAGDVVTELAAEGIDLVFSTISYTLPVHLENL